ncbi:MAG TPA: LmeA family phospholipid-binding protein [Mycobacterium sp.]|uniref:LmeA family phospholipid-binding protein n=1 Tax=Mycolicibacterium sp. TaxID=2320850 RepID=UPI0025E64611|nr:DUF2993 domain-containing protein [Mycolicibacterium sp.]HPX36455.1 LmeA family phospholipid-binding protein [Mycobacterium sp.]HQC77068.1 LmeA family phospholipid-binding protein [Mycobacterium sp.]
MPPPGPPHDPTPERPTPERPTQQIPLPPTQQIPLPPTQQIPQPAPEPVIEPAPEPQRRDPLSAVLIAVIVLALVVAGLLGGELYARHKADSIVASAVSCVVRDNASVSFGMRPFLIQHFTHSYRDMVVETAGNQIREAKGMKLRLRLDDVRINPTAESAGTLGALDADVTWSSDGIKDTVQGIIPFLGGLVSGVATDPAAGTMQLQGPLGSVTLQPQVVDKDLALTVVSVTGLGFTLPRESVQPALDAFTGALVKNLPMGIHAESVEVTDSGIALKYATRDATIPNGKVDPCFAGI